MSAGRMIGTGVIRDGNSLRNAAPQQFRDVERIVSRIVGLRRVKRPLQLGSLSLGKIPLVLAKHRRQCEDHPVVAVGLIEVTAPIIAPVAGNSLPQLGMRVCALSDQRRQAHKDKRGIIKAVLGGDDECLLRCGRRRNCARAHRAIVGHDAQNPLGLLFRFRDVFIRLLRSCVGVFDLCTYGILGLVRIGKGSG